MRDAAIDGWVLRMRRHGLRLPAHHVTEPEQATLLCINRYDEPDRFVLRVFQPGQFTDYSTEMHGARLMDSRKGCYRFQGDEWIVQAHQHFPQTLVCTPTREKAFEILAKMGEQDLRRHGLE